MAVLGELGRYPILIPALKLCLKYQFQIDHSDSNTFVSQAMNEMKGSPHIESWYTRVEKIKTLFSIPKLYGNSDKVGNLCDRLVKGKFDRFYLDEINLIKLGSDGGDHNKLRFYKTFKGSFTQEPYILNILKLIYTDTNISV